VELIKKEKIMDKKLVKGMNDQINFELYSSYLYLSMASYLKSLNLNGFSNWMDVQVKEELAHTTRFYNFLHDRGEEVVLEAIARPEGKWNSPLEVFQDALKHEKKVTERINKLTNMAAELSDHASSNFLQWFVNEQVEEEANVVNVIEQIKLVGGALFMLDRELSQRVFVDPNASAQSA
jgi:ferritin